MVIILKLVISASIVGISTYIGTSKARKLKEREYTLRDMITFLKLVENEIKYMMNILPNAYEIARQKLNTELKIKIGNIVIDMLEIRNLDLVENSIEKNISDISCLEDYDKNVIISTLKNLGRSDVEGQINIIENGITTLENQVTEANEVKLTNSKLYRTIGIIAGLMLVIIFI